MTIKEIKEGEYGITVIAEEGTYNIPAADAIDIAFYVYQRMPQLQEIMHRKANTGKRTNHESNVAPITYSRNLE